MTSNKVKGTDLVSEVPMEYLKSPNFDQFTYLERVRHFSVVTSPMTLLLSKKELYQAKELEEQRK